MHVQKQQKADAERAQFAMTHLQKDLQIADAESKKKLQKDANISRELEAAKTAVDTAQHIVDAVPLDMDEVEQLEQSAQQQRSAVQACQAKCRALESGISHNLNFSYNDPRPGFDRHSVKGVLARLVRVKDPSHATALQVAAGGRLSHVVVDTDQVGTSSQTMLQISDMTLQPVQQTQCLNGVENCLLQVQGVTCLSMVAFNAVSHWFHSTRPRHM